MTNNKYKLVKVSDGTGNETNETYTRNDHWLVRKQELLDDYFPRRTEILLSQLEAYGLYDPSGISECREDKAADEGRAYNLLGMPVGEGYHGFVVKDGKIVQMR